MAGASSASPTVTDFQGTAGQNIDNSGAQALHDVSQNGQLGQAAIAQAAQAAQAAKQAALTNAMSYSILRGAPAGNVAANQATISQPFDQRASVLGLMGQNYKDNSDAMTQANQNFTAGAKAGLPIAQTALDRTISNNQSANAAKRDTQNFELSMKQATEQAVRDAANARLAATQAKAQSPSSILAALGGSQNAGSQIESLARNATGQREQNALNDTNISAAQDDMSSGSLQDQIGQILGLAPGQGSTLTQKLNTPTLPPENAADKALGEAMGLTLTPGSTYTEHISAIRANPDYATAQNIVNGVIGHNGTTADLQAGLSQAHLNPLVVQLVLAENPNLRPTRGSAS